MDCLWGKRGKPLETPLESQGQNPVGVLAPSLLYPQYVRGCPLPGFRSCLRSDPHCLLVDSVVISVQPSGGQPFPQGTAR